MLKIGDTIQFRRADAAEGWNYGTLTIHNDGDPYVGIAVTQWFGVPHPGYASLTPGGNWQLPQPAPQGWERFIPDPNGALILAAPRGTSMGAVLTAANTRGKDQ